MAHRRTRPRARGRQTALKWTATSNEGATRNQGRLFELVTSGGEVPGTAVGLFTPEKDQDFTILRTHGSISIENITGAGTTTEPVMVAIGFGIIPTISAEAGAFPTPITDARWDGWLLHRTWMLLGLGADLGVMNNATFESKAKRRVETGYSCIFALQAQNVSEGSPGVQDIQVGAFFRQLFKDPS